MPIYLYLCGPTDDNLGCDDVYTEKECGHRERYDAPPCRKCGGATHQVPAPFGIALKGGGVGWADQSYSGGGGKKAP